MNKFRMPTIFLNQFQYDIFVVILCVAFFCFLLLFYVHWPAQIPHNRSNLNGLSFSRLSKYDKCQWKYNEIFNLYLLVGFWFLFLLLFLLNKSTLIWWKLNNNRTVQFYRYDSFTNKWQYPKEKRISMLLFGIVCGYINALCPYLIWD